MGRAETLAAVREKYPAYKEMGDDQLATALATRFPEYRDLTGEYLGGGLYRDPSGVRQLDFGDPKTAELPGMKEGLAQSRHESDVMVGLGHPKNMSESALQAVGTAPLIGAGGALAGAAKPLLAPIGRSAVAVGTKGLQNVKEGKPVTQGMLAEGAAALTGEAATRVGGKILGKVAERATRETAKSGEVAQIAKEGGEVFPELAVVDSKEIYDMVKKWGHAQVERVSKPMLDEVTRRVKGMGAVRIDVPALGDKRVSIDEAVKAMFDPANKAIRSQIRADVIATLKRLDPSGETASILDEGLKARAAAHTYLGIMGKAIDPKTGKVDPDRIIQLINRKSDEYSRYAGKYWPMLEKLLLRGGKAGETAVSEKAKAWFGHRTLGDRVPMGAARTAEKALPMATSQGVKAGTTAAATTEAPGTGVPFGVLADAWGLSHLPKMLHGVPGARMLEHALDDVAE